jgi:uncharacterized tellurite resistance protein B-like protein
LNGEEMDAKTLLKSLILMARIDVKITQQEIRQLALTAAKFGVPVEEIEAAWHGVDGKAVQLAVSNVPEEGRVMLQEMARMMCADGELARSERGLLHVFGKALGFSETDVNAIIGAAL